MSDIIEVKAGIEAENDRYAAMVRDYLKEKGVFLINLMGSPGSGKTSLLLKTIGALKDRYRIGVIEADMDADVDARAVEAAGARALQVHTCGSCHMDARMTLRGLEAMDLSGLDLVFLENVGNLVCPAEFEVGADLRVMILSVPEGDDKPLKYPLMFRISDCLLVNKIDTAAVFDFDISRCEENVAPLNSGITIIPISAKTGAGMEEWISWLEERLGPGSAEYEGD